MAAKGFCSDSFNILLQHGNIDVIQIKRIASTSIGDLANELYATLCDLLEHPDVIFHGKSMENTLPPCQRLLQNVDVDVYMANFGSGSSDVFAKLTLVRQSALFLDIALVSYARSHGSGFDIGYFGTEMDSLKVTHGIDTIAFTCSWARLACLDEFLDRRKVWVFRSCNVIPDQSLGGLNTKTRTKALLCRIGDLADIWGPVITVPSFDPARKGLIRFYGVSKGVICRTNAKASCAIPGAVNCHYFTRPSFLGRKASTLLCGGNELLLAHDDLLLI